MVVGEVEYKNGNAKEKIFSHSLGQILISFA